MTLRAARFALISAGLFSTFVSEGSAQGPAYRERWGYLHLERRRSEVFDELRGRDADARKAVATLLSSPGEGVPFRPVAAALAYLRGAEADDAFQLRCALGLFVLPEVVDPDGKQPACRSANFSVHLPFSLPSAGEMSFEISVRDAAGELAYRESVTDPVGIQDVQLAQVEVSVPGAGLADGVYEVSLRTLIEGAGPRAYDPELRWSFHVLRGYQERAELAMGKAVALREGLDPLPRALVDGFAAHVSRVYTGEAFAVQSEAVADLRRLEQCLDNLAAERDPLDAIFGDVPTALPGDGGAQPCLLRVNTARKHRPTVCFASGAPSYGVGARRPASPVVRDARWLRRELGSFGEAEGWNLAVFDSPGGGRRYGESLLAALKALPDVLPSGDTKPLLVCDREAASVVGIQLAKFEPLVAGVVFVGAGVVPAPALAALDGLPVRFVELSGYPASGGIRRLMDYVTTRPVSERDALDLEWLHERPTLWPYGVAFSLPEVRAFAEQLFGDR